MNRLAICACLAACASGPSTDRATLGNLELEVPSGWSSRDLSTRHRAMSEWSPPANEHRQSITVVRAERAGLGKKPARVRKLLEEAQHGLPNGAFSSPTDRPAATPCVVVWGAVERSADSLVGRSDE